MVVSACISYVGGLSVITPWSLAIKVSFFGAILASFRGPRAARHICSRDILLLTGGGRRLRADSGSVVLENAGACLTSCHLARLSPPLIRPDYVAFIPTWELGEGRGGSIENLDLFKCAAHCDKGVVGLSRFFLLRRAGGESPALVR